MNKPILVLGQDWGNTTYFKKYVNNGKDNNRTNQNLKRLLTVRELSPGLPSSPTPQPLFFTNVILAPFEPTTQRIKSIWLKEGVHYFIDPLLKILSPRLIITLGKQPYEALRQYGLHGKNLPKQPLKNLIGQQLSYHQHPLAPVYHCGGLGLAQRSFLKQEQDWLNITL